MGRIKAIPPGDSEAKSNQHYFVKSPKEDRPLLKAAFFVLLAIAVHTGLLAVPRPPRSLPVSGLADMASLG